MRKLSNISLLCVLILSAFFANLCKCSPYDSPFFFFEPKNKSIGKRLIGKMYREMLSYKNSDDCLYDLFYKNNIKVIAIDIDGTLANDSSKISDENLNAISAARKLGINVILATGRLRNHALKMFDPQQIQKFEVNKFDGIFSHGATLHLKGYPFVYRKFSHRDLNLVLFSLMYHKVLKKAAFITKEDTYVFNDDPKFKNLIYKNESEVEEDANISVEYIKTVEPFYDAILLKHMKDLYRVGDIIAIEIFDKLYPEQESSNKILTKIVSELNPYFKIFLSESNSRVTISPLNTTKAQAIDLYARLYDVHLNEVLSIGNDFNDVELLGSTGYSVAVKNSIEAASKVAKCISIKTNNENSVADIIYKVIIGRKL